MYEKYELSFGLGNKKRRKGRRGNGSGKRKGISEREKGQKRRDKRKRTSGKGGRDNLHLNKKTKI